jgi:hypothetical protein
MGMWKNKVQNDKTKKKVQKIKTVVPVVLENRAIFI